ncbi:MAG: flagellar basal body L-ring protein FlgH [bacterium]|nr:flagellar basal body L-ring protein FlgH [bacterium]
MIRSTTMLVLLLLLAVPIQAQVPLWDSDAGGSLFSNTKAHRVGDILKVMVTENSSASSDAKTGTESKTDLSGGPGTGALNFIPLWSASQSTKYDGKGQTTRKGALNAVISVQIVEIISADQFRIEGTREIKRNGEIEIMTLSGIIRRRDISPQNTINSTAIANATIHYDGEGDVANGNEPGFLTRLVNWFF